MPYGHRSDLAEAVREYLPAHAPGHRSRSVQQHLGAGRSRRAASALVARGAVEKNDHTSASGAWVEGATEDDRSQDASAAMIWSDGGREIAGRSVDDR